MTKKNLFRFPLFITACLACILIISTDIYANESIKPYAEYTIDIKSELQDLNVRICFNGPVPAYLSSGARGGGENLISMTGDHEDWLANGHAERIKLKDLGDGTCFQYQASLDDNSRNDRRFRRLHENLQKNNIAVPASSWLWLPEQITEMASIQMIFRHPDGYAVSAPWKLISRSESETRYELGRTAFDRKAITAFGNFIIQDIYVPGAVLRLATLNGIPPADNTAVRKWIEQGALFVSKAYGQFPIPSAQIMVIPVGATNRGPVPWGQVLRGGGTSAQLYIDQTRPIEEHIHDWTLIHELCHMLHPYLGESGAWLAEGLATYYQNIVQARGGTLSPQQAWQKLHDGFQRGIKQTRSGITLEESSRKRSRDSFMRIYWSGAAISMLADISLRTQGSSLDSVLSEFQKCCLSVDRTWTPREFMAMLDQLGSSSIFTSLFEEYTYSDRFPDLKGAYKELGIEIRNGKVNFGDDAETEKLRDNIMTGNVKLKHAEITYTSNH